jgi:hypothetical protein
MVKKDIYNDLKEKITGVKEAKSAYEKHLADNDVDALPEQLEKNYDDPMIEIYLTTFEDDALSDRTDEQIDQVRERLVQDHPQLEIYHLYKTKENKDEKLKEKFEELGKKGELYEIVKDANESDGKNEVLEYIRIEFGSEDEFKENWGDKYEINEKDADEQTEHVDDQEDDGIEQVMDNGK